MGKVDSIPKRLTAIRQQSQRLLYTLLISATATACFGLPIPSAATEQNPKPPAQPRRINRNSIWDAILQLLKRRDEPALISRGNVCAIAPGLLGKTNVIWSDRPLFLWQGNVQRLEVRPYSLYSSQAYSLYSSQEVLWSQTVTKGTRSVIYTGEALQPGLTYDWELVVVDSSSPGDSKPRPLRFTFQVMEALERDRIAAELTAIATRLKTVGATAEAIAHARANYFAQRDLWTDALQEIFSVQNPSAELTRTAQEISAYVCGSNS